MLYDRIGRAALRVSLSYLRRRYREQLRIGLGLAAFGLAVAGFLASRNVPEG